MKNYVCDFCDAMTMGYKQFKKEFNSVRHARKLAKSIVPGIIGIPADKDMAQKIVDIRKEAGSVYNPDWEKNNAYLKPKEL